jgi:exopolysaccharide biosynthesis polyprenyl glycosylphosphotransferase
MKNERQLSKAQDYSEILSAPPIGVGATRTKAPAAKFNSKSVAREIGAKRKRPFQRAIIVGTDETGLRLANELKQHFPEDFVIVGFVSDDNEVGQNPHPEFPLIGKREELAALVREHRVNRVMFSNCVDWQLEGTGLQIRAAQDRRGRGKENANAPARGKRDRRREVSDLYEWATSHSFLWPNGRRAKLYGFAKRSFDIIFSIIALTLTLPLALIVFPTIKLTSPGPIFYEQERVGRGGKSFIIYKLRTMSVNAEKETGPTLSPQGDKRSTWFGRLLRVLKLDEFPQFWNVLKGDMSIVGPRPERPHFVEPFNGHIYSYSLRHTVQPGLTGLAQVKGDHLTHVYVKLHYDLIYVCKRNFLLDLTILAKTPLFIVQNMMRRS